MPGRNFQNVACGLLVKFWQNGSGSDRIDPWFQKHTAPDKFRANLLPVVGCL